MTEADLNVAAAALDADGSGDVSFSEFYGWFTRAGGDNADGDDDTITEAGESRSNQPGTRGIGGRDWPRKAGAAGTGRKGITGAMRSTFVKVKLGWPRWDTRAPTLHFFGAGHNRKSSTTAF